MINEQVTEEIQDELVDIWDVEVEEEVEQEETEETEEVEDTSEEVEETEELETQAEDTTAEETTEELPLVKSIQKLLGYELEGEFEDTDEGIAQMFEAAKNIAADQALEALLDRYPEAKEFIEYRELGGDPDRFFKAKFPDIDFETVEFKEADERQHEMLIREDLRKKGYTDTEIEADIEDFKNGGILESKAQRALQSLKAKQKQDKDNLLVEQQRQYAEQQQQIEQYWNDIKQTIEKSTTFKSFSVPASDKTAFFDYISKPVKDGKSQRDLDVEQSDLETQLAVDFILFKKFKLGDIIERKAKDINAKTLRQRMKTAKLDKKVESNSQEYTDELGEI